MNKYYKGNYPKLSSSCRGFETRFSQCKSSTLTWGCACQCVEVKWSGVECILIATCVYVCVWVKVIGVMVSEKSRNYLEKWSIVTLLVHSGDQTVNVSVSTMGTLR